MGMQWIFDTLNYFVFKNGGSNHLFNILFCIEVIFDSLKGLLIFIIFVLKKNVYQAIRKRLQDIKRNQSVT